MDCTQECIDQGRSVYMCLLTGTVWFNDSDTVLFHTGSGRVGDYHGDRQCQEPGRCHY